MMNSYVEVSYDEWLSKRPKRSKSEKCSRGHTLSDENVVFRKNSYHGSVRMCKKCLKLKTDEPKTRSRLFVGYVNPHGVTIVGGPERVRNTLSWWSTCPFCKKEFLTTTHSFDTVKTCYGCRSINRRTDSEITTWKVLFGVTRGRKRAKELGFDLTIDKFIKISSMPCTYCGADPKPKNIGKPWYPAVMSHGLDRVDSDIGYLESNVVSCCERCNAAKGTVSVEEFKVFISKIYERFVLSE
jgi:hypothetical protein